MFNRVAGQVEVTAGQVNFRGSLPHSEKNVFHPMLDPVTAHQRQMFARNITLYAQDG